MENGDITGVPGETIVSGRGFAAYGVAHTLYFP